MAKEVPHMVRGMSMATRLITLLVDKIREREGHEEMLHFLTTEPGRDNLDKVAEFIVSLKWTIPKSIVMKLARDLSLKDDADGKYADSDELFFWQPALNKLGIPLISFNIEGKDMSEDCRWPIPSELREQLDGKAATAAMLVEWEGETFVVVGLSFNCDESAPKVGDVIDMDNIFFLHLTHTRYFDLDN